MAKRTLLVCQILESISRDALEKKRGFLIADLKLHALKMGLQKANRLIL